MYDILNSSQKAGIWIPYTIGTKPLVFSQTTLSETDKQNTRQDQIPCPSTSFVNRYIL